MGQMPAVAEVPWDDAAAAALRAAQEREIADRYGDEDTEPITGDGMLTTLVVHHDGTPVGCVSLRDAAPGHGAGTGEVKRLYVAPGARGRGLGRALVLAVEARAAALGLTRLVLESGVRQPESVALYRSLGWDAITPYGPWADHPETLCFGKAL
ncbi:GNAT family N-acetyltransferase [Cellulomonas triticagri]|uniref:GNAT family N-acetyltransferase n=2 Tax=Cellulomonas triticagri TaxID=2483352 RepID=A0A3M2JNS2_9CELL|nr:GNAT family N-acetyltransferase [Cellulomonas triticagri]